MIQKTLTIPTNLSSNERQQLAQDVIDLIKSRTRDGLDYLNKPFAPYSKNYLNHRDFDGDSNVDLELSGDMLENIELISHGSGFLVIGISDKDNSDKAKWVQSPTGQKKNVPPRVFLDISPKDLRDLIDKIDPSKRETQSIVNRITSRIVRF